MLRDASRAIAAATFLAASACAATARADESRTFLDDALLALSFGAERVDVDAVNRRLVAEGFLPVSSAIEVVGLQISARHRWMVFDFHYSGLTQAVGTGTGFAGSSPSLGAGVAWTRGHLAVLPALSFAYNSLTVRSTARSDIGTQSAELPVTNSRSIGLTPMLGVNYLISSGTVMSPSFAFGFRGGYEIPLALFRAHDAFLANAPLAAVEGLTFRVFAGVGVGD